MFRLWGFLLSQITKTLYPALTQSNLESENVSNYKNYVFQAQSSPFWKKVEFEGFTLPAQGEYKAYCMKWISWGCDNIKQHPRGKHYAEHEVKTCKTANCPKCFESWINRQANRTTRRLAKFKKDRVFNFRHIVLSPPPERAKEMSYPELKKWLAFALKVANIQTCAIFFHPFRFDRKKQKPYDSPHFHLLVYGKITNTIEFYNKTRDRDGNSWLIKNKGDMTTDVDIFNCVRYLLSHAGVRKRTHVVRYLGDISYRKLKVEKEPKNHVCPYCELPLTIFFITNSPKSKKPPIDYVGLWEPSNFEPVYPEDNDGHIPFYESNDDGYTEELIYSFEENLSVKTNLPIIQHRKFEISQTRFVTSLNCQKLDTFCI